MNETERLIAALRDPDEYVRWSAAVSLGKLRDLRAVEPLLEPLVFDFPDEPVPTWAERAADALVSIGVPAVPTLIALLKHADPNIRGGVAKVLGRIGDARAVEPLISALRDPSGHVRWCAAFGLGKIGDPRAVPPLVARMRDEFKWKHEYIEYALRDVGSPAVGPLVAALRSWNHNVQWRAVCTLGGIGDPRAVQPLIAALRAWNKGVRWVAACALGGIGDPHAVPPLIVALHDRNEEVRRHAAEALGRIGDPRAIEPLIATLGDSVEEVRSTAARNLLAFGETSIRPLQQALLAELDERTQGEIRSLLNVAEERWSIPKLSPALELLVVPKGKAVSIWKPVEPMPQTLSHAISEMVRGIPGIGEAYLPKCFAEGIVDPPAQVLVLVLDDATDRWRVLEAVGQGLACVLPQGTRLAVWPLSERHPLLSKVRRAGVQIHCKPSPKKKPWWRIPGRES